MTTAGPNNNNLPPSSSHDSRSETTGRPTAVAIRYDQSEAAPRVVAKGYGTIADTIIRTAKDHGLYVHESPELVGLLMQVNLDAHIPPQLYVAIAELLAWIYTLEEKAAAITMNGMPNGEQSSDADAAQPPNPDIEH